MRETLVDGVVVIVFLVLFDWEGEPVVVGVMRGVKLCVPVVVAVLVTEILRELVELLLADLDGRNSRVFVDVLEGLEVPRIDRVGVFVTRGLRVVLALPDIVLLGTDVRVGDPVTVPERDVDRLLLAVAVVVVDTVTISLRVPLLLAVDVRLFVVDLEGDADAVEERDDFCVKVPDPVEEGVREGTKLLEAVAELEGDLLLDIEPVFVGLAVDVRLRVGDDVVVFEDLVVTVTTDVAVDVLLELIDSVRRLVGFEEIDGIAVLDGARVGYVVYVVKAERVDVFDAIAD